MATKSKYNRNGGVSSDIILSPIKSQIEKRGLYFGQHIPVMFISIKTLRPRDTFYDHGLVFNGQTSHYK